MWKWLLSRTPVLVLILLGILTSERSIRAQGVEDSSPTLRQLVSRQLKIVDLTYPLNKNSAYWPGESYKPFQLKTIATLEKDGVLSKAFSMPEHLGTHIDAPNHFEHGQPSVDQIDPSDLFAPGVVLDVSGPVSSDADFQLQPEHISAWEERHGRIPKGAVVLLHSGWGRYWNNSLRYQNRDVRDRLHFPGFSADAARLLVHQRQIRGVGIDTLSVDHGLSTKFEVHHILGTAGRFGIENVANSEKLPPRDFYLVIAPIKIETGSGGPIRLLAIIP